MQTLEYHRICTLFLMSDTKLPQVNVWRVMTECIVNFGKDLGTTLRTFVGLDPIDGYSYC